jgi:hypothetical protein
MQDILAARGRVSRTSARARSVVSSPVSFSYVRLGSPGHSRPCHRRSQTATTHGEHGSTDLESVWLAYVRRGVRFWEQDGSDHRHTDALKRGRRSRMEPRDQPRRLPSDHPLACPLCCGPGRREFESFTGCARTCRLVQQRNTATCARYGCSWPTSTCTVGCTVATRPWLCR